MEQYKIFNVETLEQAVGASWTNIRNARSNYTVSGMKVLEDTLRSVSSEFENTLLSNEISIVVFGSLARKEFTSGSDIDWTLLIDGKTDPQHLDIALKFENELKNMTIGDKEVKAPGVEATFGGLAFGHDIIHKIGGGDDSNRNTTQRILLLLESAAIGHRHGDNSTHERLMIGVLNRYVIEDRATLTSAVKVPRFLLNDIVRYWRTMAVDFGYKRRQRQGKGAALRTVKLKLSRKMIYVSGLLACFACELDNKLAHDVASVAPNVAESQKILVDYLFQILQPPPLDNLASFILSHEAERHQPLYESAKKVFDHYDLFLQLIDNAQNREHLEKLLPHQTDSDTLYRKAKKISDCFQEGLDGIFFDENGTGLFPLVKKYGVF